MNKTKLIIKVYYYKCKYNNHSFVSLKPCTFCIECNKPIAFVKVIDYEINLENNTIKIKN